MHGDEPISEAKVGRFHNGAATKSGSSSAILTLKLFNRFHPVMGSPFAISTSNAFCQTLFPKIISAR
jgi:hypothetical protein